MRGAGEHSSREAGLRFNADVYMGHQGELQGDALRHTVGTIADHVRGGVARASVNTCTAPGNRASSFYGFVGYFLTVAIRRRSAIAYSYTTGRFR